MDLMFCSEARFDMQDEMASQHEEKISQILQEIETHKSQPVGLKLPPHSTVDADASDADTVSRRESSA